MPKKNPDMEAPALPAEPAEEMTQVLHGAPPAEIHQAAEHNKSGFYMYIGPSIKGVIRSGTIYRGDRENACKVAVGFIESPPKLKDLMRSLIVSGDALPQARRKVKESGNILYNNYHELKELMEGK